MAETQTPLSEADPKSLDELFNEDPLNLTDSDVERLVAELRANRHLWKKEDAEAKSQDRARRPSKYKPKVEKGKLSLADLGLGKKQ